MRFSLFAHMERITTDQSQLELYEDFISLCCLADQGGMHAIWSGEHHGMNFTIAPNPLLNLVDLSHRTKNVRLGTGTIVAPFWHPIKLAGEAAMADIITQGRLDLGIARGAYSYEYERLLPGLEAFEAGQRMRELIPAVQRLWQGDYQHEGDFYQFPSTTSSPKPLQQGGPPIWVAARDINSHDFAVANGCNVQVTPLWSGYDEIESLMQRFKEACNTHQRRPQIMLLQHTYVGTNASEIEAAAKKISRFYCYFGAWFKNEKPVTQGLLQPLSDSEMAASTIYSPEVMLNNMPIGTPQQVIDKLKRYEDLGYDEFSYWLDSSMSTEEKKTSLSRFINDVMPAFA